MSQQYGTVERVERLSPSMLRIVLGGEGLAEFEPNGATDQYVNARFVPDGATYGVPFDDDDVAGLPAALRPKPRRFTVRRWDGERRELTIDFVAHGDVGFAGRWAQQAKVGDRLQMTGPNGSYRPDPTADWYLMVGDESALPAIGAILEVLAAEACGVVVVVIDRAENEIELQAPGGVDVRWVHRASVADPEMALLDAVRAIEWQPGAVDVVVHGEAAEVRAVRRHLVLDRGVDKDTAAMSPYWRRGHTDEAWREVKRQWLAEQAGDV